MSITLSKDTKPFAQPINQPISDRKYRLVENFIYVYKANDTIFRISVPAGFESDGTSSPKWSWSVFERDGIWRAAALVHDYIYHYKGFMPGNSYEFLDGNQWKKAPKIAKIEADRIFLQILRESGVPKFRRQVATAAVLLFGDKAWND